MATDTRAMRSDIRLLGPSSPALLQPIVEAARSVFAAAASSIFILDPAAKKVVFGAVAGEGEQTLVGQEFPADAGVVGWVISSHESVQLAELDNTFFNLDAAKSTGYVPSAIMAAPLLYGDDCVGVLEVLDWRHDNSSEQSDLELLQLIAAQAAAAIRLLALARGPEDPFAMPETIGLIELVGRQLGDLSPADRRERVQLLTTMVSMLGRSDDAN